MKLPAYKDISIDTRTLSKNDLFIAIKGENFDGHDFVSQAWGKGAIAAIVSEKQDCDLPQILVKDTRLALGEIAAEHRQAFDIPIIAVTGSCGKTTTKAIIASILKQKNNPLSPEHSFNNDIGMPLTLLMLNKQHDMAVLEMGTNHHGEIDYLTKIAKPTVAMILNAAQTHLDALKDVAGVAKAKSEIFHGLSNDGTAIINADDEFADCWRDKIGNKKILTFGLERPADITAKKIKTNDQGVSNFLLCLPKEEIAVQFPLLGKHNVMNALAAAAACYSVGVSTKNIKAGLESAKSEKQRLIKQVGVAGSTIIDDTYNANPRSMSVALELLSQMPGEKIFVMGDMGELGKEAEEFHAEVGEKARKLGIKQLYATGKLSKNAVDSFGEGAFHFSDHDSLADELRPHLESSTTVLIKGSRSAKMEKVVERIRK